MVFRALSAVVGLAAIAPFAFAVACGPKSSDAPPPPPPATASVTPSASSPPLVVEPSAPAAPASSSAPPTPSYEMPEHVFADGPCAERNAAERWVQARRKCTSDADCAVFNPSCACAMGVQKSALAEAKRRSDSAYEVCIKRKLPIPCATCPPAPPPRCADGTCRP